MGLDAVEIVMEVEEAFDIRLEDAEVEKISTPRDVIELVLSKVQRADVSGCLTQRAFNRLRAALLRHRPLQRRDVAPDVRMASLAPRGERQRLVDRLATDLGTPPLPPLVRPPWLVALLGAGCVATGLGLAVLGFGREFWEHRGAGFLTALAATAAAGCLAQVLTRGHRTEFPPQVATVGELSRWIVAHKPDLARATPGTWAREQVAARIREITIRHLECAATYREDASFVQDLGMG